MSSIRTGLIGLTVAGDAVPIANGVLTVAQGVTAVNPETGTTDDLDTISLSGALSALGFSSTYAPLIILQGTTSNTITVKHGTGNIQLNNAADLSLGATDALMLFYDGTNWHDLGY